MRNVYNTTDPTTLLKLKRMEADALLDVLRSMNHYELTERQLCLIARNTLRAQLGVRKLYFWYLSDEGWQQGIRVGFEPMCEGTLEELSHIHQTTKTDAQHHPLLHKLGAEYVVPIIHRADPRAYMIVADFADTEVELQGDLIFIETMGNIVYVALQNKWLFRSKMREESLRKELEVAETIQNQLLISDFHRFQKLDIYASNTAHHGIGGDFFDIIQKGAGETFVCIADVSGKGIAAALLMSNLQANLRALCAQYTCPTTIISELNNLLFQITKGEKFVTLFLARIDTQKQEMTFVNAGHNYPLFFHQQKVHPLKTGCMLLGIMPDIPVSEETLSYEVDDVLFAYTDGLVEQQNPEGEMLGDEQVEEELAKQAALSSQELLQHFHEIFKDFASTAEVTDDITMLSVKFQ